MTLLARLREAGRVFLDTAPLIYFVEGHPRYSELLTGVFKAIDDGEIAAVVSPVTLAASLVQPFRAGRADFAAEFTARIVRGANTQFLQVDSAAVTSAARLRAQYNFTLTDAIQLALATDAGCRVLLTNDFGISRVRTLEVLVLDDFLSDAASA